MIAHVRFPFLIEFLVDRATTAKAEILRVRAMEYLIAIVLNKEWRRVVHFRCVFREGLQSRKVRVVLRVEEVPVEIVIGLANRKYGAGTMCHKC